MKKTTRALLLSIGLALPVVVGSLARRPDTVIALRMRLALVVKRHADMQSEAWSALSARAATSYQKLRL